MFLNIWKISVSLGRIVLGQTQAWERGGGSEVGVHRRGLPREAAVCLVPMPVGHSSGQQTILDWASLGPGSELPIFLPGGIVC